MRTKNWQKSYSVTKGLVPVIDLHKLKNVHDEVFNFSRFQLTTQHVAAIVCVLAAQIFPLGLMKKIRERMYLSSIRGSNMTLSDAKIIFAKRK